MGIYVTDSRAVKAFPLRGRCPEGADEVAARMSDCHLIHRFAVPLPLKGEGFSASATSNDVRFCYTYKFPFTFTGICKTNAQKRAIVC